MLEYDDQLPEEEAHPELLRELQATYHMKQEEEQVLARVREQLLKKTTPPISRKEHTPLEASSYKKRTRLQFSPFQQPTQRKWVQRINGLVAVLFVAALVGALAFTFSRINHTRNQADIPTSPAAVKTFVNLTEGLRLYMVNDQIGWEMGDNAHTPYTTILRTTDGGKHWRSVTPAGLYQIGAIYIIDENTAWLPVWNAKKSIFPTALYRTINGGTTWQYFDCPGAITCGLATFADQDHGWTIYQPLSNSSPFKQQTPLSKQPASKIVKPELYHTNDGGKTWQSIAGFNISGGAPQLSFLNAQTGWVSTIATSQHNEPRKGVATTSGFFVTHDGGHTWKAQHLPVPPGEVQSQSQSDISLLPTFLNERDGYLVAQFRNHSYLYITQNGGNSWQVHGNALPDASSPKKLLDMQHLVASTVSPGPPTGQASEDIAMLTLKNGKWVQTILSLPGKSPVVDYSFTSKDVGIALVNASSPSAFDMYKTTNGGKTWQKISRLLKSS